MSATVPTPVSATSDGPSGSSDVTVRVAAAGPSTRGSNDTVTASSSPGARIIGTDRPTTVNTGSVVEMSVTVRSELPSLPTITTAVWLVEISTSPKSSEASLRVRLGSTPSAVRATVASPSGSSEVTTRSPATEPGSVGANVRDSSADPPGSITRGVRVDEVKPAGGDTPVIVNAPVPVLVAVTVNVADVAVSTGPKAREVGLSSSCGMATALPATGITNAPFGSFEVTVTSPTSAPGAVGL